MKIKELDYVLIPIGLSVMIAYHLWLLYMIITQPNKTVIGINSFNRRIWVRTMMKDPTKNGILAVQTLRNNIMASTVMASTAIVLASLIAVLMTNTSLEPLLHHNKAFLGNKTDVFQSIKLFSILVCFLLAFLLGIQSVRYYNHTNVLINVPTGNNRVAAVNYVTSVLNRGGMFWSMGLRAYYFSFPLFLWVFGPIPMLACSCILVLLLFFLDMHYGYAPGHDLIWDDDDGDC